MSKFLFLLCTLVFLGCSHPTVNNSPNPPPRPNVQHIVGNSWELDIPADMHQLKAKKGDPDITVELLALSTEVDRVVVVSSINRSNLEETVEDLASALDVMDVSHIKWHNKDAVHFTYVNLDDTYPSLVEVWMTTHNNKIYTLGCTLVAPKAKSDWCSNIASNMTFK